MLPVTFPEQNFTFHKPNDMTDEQCSSLSVFKGHDTENIPCIVSCWQFSKEDLEEIQKTGRIWLSITGHTMPPVSLFTENPFVEQKEG